MRRLLMPALFTLVLPLAAQAYTYDIQVLGALASDDWSSANGLNDFGQTVGQSTGSLGPSAFWFGAAGMKFIPIPSGYSRANAYDINASGLVVGTYGYMNYWGEYSAVYVYDTQTYSLSDIGSLGFDRAYGYGINSSATIVGSGYLSSSNTHRAWLRQANGTLIDLDAKISGSIHSEAFDINDAGQVVGISAISGVGYRGFLYDSLSDTMTLLDAPGGNGSRANGINSLGQAVGMDSSLYHASAVRFDGTWPIDLGNVTNGEALAINAHGTVVGFFGTSNGSHAFVYDQTGIHDLNDLISPMTGWEITQANDINDSGQIAAFGYLGSHARALLLTPVPEPASVLLLLAGTGLMMSRRSRT